MEVLFTLLAERYERRSVVFASNLVSSTLLASRSGIGAEVLLLLILPGVVLHESAAVGWTIEHSYERYGVSTEA